MRSKICAALIAASFAVPAFAGERVARQGNDEVRVFDSPCVSAETIARILPNAREGWGKVIGVFGGQRYFGCWRPMGESAYILWEDGDQGIVPNAELKEVLGV